MLLANPVEASNERGLAIATEVDNRDKGWGDVTVEGEMVLKNKAGNESVRKFRSTILEAADASEGDRSIITFSQPRDVRGTALLTHSKIEPDDDSQWIFLPAVKRVKRISSSNRTGKFVSSEFSYEDLGSEEVADNEHIWLEDAVCAHDGALTCAAVWKAARRTSGPAIRSGSPSSTSMNTGCIRSISTTAAAIWKNP